jgi:hypothetical protein
VSVVREDVDSAYNNVDVAEGFSSELEQFLDLLWSPDIGDFVYSTSDINQP